MCNALHRESLIKEGGLPYICKKLVGIDAEFTCRGGLFTSMADSHISELFDRSSVIRLKQGELLVMAGDR